MNNLRTTNQSLQTSIAFANMVVYKTYLEELDSMDIVDCPSDLRWIDINDIARFFKIERFVYAANENNRDKLMSIFQAVSRCGGSIVVLINSDGKRIEFYIAAKNDNLNDLDDSSTVLEKSLAGNFPGTKLSQIPGGNPINDMLENIFTNTFHRGQKKQISTITGIAALRRKEESGEKQFVQGMEKLIDSMQGERYSLLLIADPVPQSQIEQIKNGYKTLYSELSPYAAWDLNFGENESSSVSDSISKNTSETINKSISDTLSYTKGSTAGSSDSVGGHIGIIVIGGSYSHGWNRGTSESDTKSRSRTEGASHSDSSQYGRSETSGTGTNRSIQLKFEDKKIKDLMEKINLQLKRLDTSADTGMWNCSVYCLADNAPTSKIVASAYQSLLRGENSSVETGAITVWTDEKSEKILPYLQKMHHPRLLLNGMEINPTSFISSAELAIHAGIPQTSVGGLPVLTMAAFGREVVPNREEGNAHPRNGGIFLGKIYHMGKIDNIEDQVALPVILDKQSLTAHTFITGSTGSGKSNAVYQILGEIINQNARFMVIEPAKGEYKNVFGGREDVYVYGTNPKKTPLLRLNPFKFPVDIHLLEHLDRLVEIFNVCWPMYAAMPSVLKDSIEEAYQTAGWDLQKSENTFDPLLYPTFVDVIGSLKRVIDESEYSEENKGNYKGSLETRLKSLTNGINGMIFVNEELSNEELFDKNVIVDISRVGSVETKALIMGILVMKLQEYRQTSGRMNSDLQHITVLEEAHNLLKRTSAEQLSESSNLLGKSVEMLTNAIAEMRTYGEGFIIADQSPGLLDMSVIRNTNTKIILRLPDQGDRELVGKSVGLNNDQITELAKLQQGVAAVYQNDWIQSVLCKVERFHTLETIYRYENKEPYKTMITSTVSEELKQKIVLYLFSKIDIADGKIDELKDRIIRSNIENTLKLRLYSYFDTRKPTGNAETLTDIIAGLFPFKSHALNRYRAGFPLTLDWAESFYEELKPQISMFDNEIQELILRCIIAENAKNPSLRELPVEWYNLNWRLENGSIENT
jgi:DNA helicase HerA-like ATPase